MNMQKIIKFNLYMSCVLLGVLVLMLVSATVAYFTDTKQLDNTLTAGNVKIVLSEAAVKADASGNLVEDTESPRIMGGADVVVNDYGIVYPGQSIYKDPTIRNTGTGPAWIAAIVTLKDGPGDLTELMGYEGYETIDIEVLLSGGLLDEPIHFGTWNDIPDVCHNENYAMIQIADAASGTYKFLFLMLQPVQAGESVQLFDHVILPSEWTNDDMQHLEDLEIHVQAFGVQTLQLESCLQAMTEAFPTHFNIN